MNTQDPDNRSAIYYISSHHWNQKDQGSGPILILSMWLDSQLPQNNGLANITRNSAELVFDLMREIPATVQFQEYPNGHFLFSAPKNFYLSKVLEALSSKHTLLGLSITNGSVTNFDFSGINS